MKTDKLALKFLGRLPWGSHICVFYGTTKDLIDILVPYFKAGLENNEFCFWITSSSLGKKEAIAAMSKEIPDLTRYAANGQIEFMFYTMVYLKDGVFNMQKALNIMADKTRQALDNGYDGLRGAGYVPWFNKEEWLALTRYEGEVNNAIDNTRTLALCTYPLDKFKAREIIDIMSVHQYVIDKYVSFLISVIRNP